MEGLLLMQMEAERRLLLAALEDAANQRFVLLSETCVPLFPPAAVWLQLMHESRSRLNACARNTTADVNRRMIFRRECCDQPAVIASCFGSSIVGSATTV